MQTVRCEYTATLLDFSEAMKGYRRVSKPAQISYLLLVWLLPALLGVFGLLCVLMVFRGDLNSSGSTYLMIAVLLGGAFGLPARYRVGVRRAFAQRNVLTNDRPMFLEFNDDRIRFVVPDGTEVSYPWSAFTEYFENEHVLVLFIKDAAFHTIPKSAMDNEGLALFHLRVIGKLRKA